MSTHPRISLLSALLVSVSVLPSAAIARPADSSTPLLVAHDMPGMTPTGEDEAHHHQAVEIPAGQPVPTVKLIVHPDALTGWNLELQMTHFTFAPEQVNTKGNMDVGHAHLFIDGKKVTRLYGTWYYLPSLPPGEHNIQVKLNTNTHQDLMHNGKPIEATATILVKETP